MRRMGAVVMIAMLLIPGVALAGASTDAALGLGAFAVFNQMISGTGIFGHSAPAVVAQPSVIERQIVVAPLPPGVVYQTAVPVYYRTYVQYVPAQPSWCPPGLAKQGRCGEHWRHHHR